MPVGRLVLVPTPIGNLGDITLRAIDTLRGADVVACEDTRHTRKLFAHHDIRVRRVPYHSHNESSALPELLERLRAGETVALVSDAGTPGIADPGQRLVAACVSAGVPVEVLPGPSALITALAQSGLPTDGFCFLGWVPRKAGERRALAERLSEAGSTTVLYESPKRLASSLAVLSERLGDRAAVVARELTKVHEEVMRGTVSELAERVRATEATGGVKGEVVLLIGPAVLTASRTEPGDDDIALVLDLEAAGESVRDAVRTAATQRGIPRRALYEAVLARKRSGTLS